MGLKLWWHKRWHRDTKASRPYMSVGENGDYEEGVWSTGTHWEHYWTSFGWVCTPTVTGEGSSVVYNKLEGTYKRIGAIAIESEGSTRTMVSKVEFQRILREQEIETRDCAGCDGTFLLMHMEGVRLGYIEWTICGDCYLKWDRYTKSLMKKFFPGKNATRKGIMYQL